MKIHKNHTKSIVLSILIGATAVIAITPTLSYWLITNQNSYSANDTLNEDSYDIDFSAADSDAYHTVSVYRAFAEPSDYVEVKGETITVDSEAAFDAFEALLDEYGIQGASDIYVSTGTSSTSDHQHYYQGENTLYSEEKITLSDGSEVALYTVNILETIMDDYKSGFFGIGSYHTYSGSYSVDTYTLAVGDPKVDENDTNNGYYGQFQVRSGEIITSKMFSTFFSSMEEDYYFSSFIYTDLTSKTPFYLNETTVNEDLSLYVVFYKQEPITLGLSSLTDEINNNTDTLKVSNGGTTSYDLNSDIGYDSETQTVNVGYFDRDTVVASGTTVNLCLTDGSIETSNEYDSSNTSQVIDENDSSKTCDYTVKLTGNLVIYGELTVGAELGSATNQGVQGNINSHYVKLDLCGHTIDINYGGSLVGYGVITDSVGNGEIHVNGGGTITSPIAAYDYKGGSSTIGSFAFDAFPFSNYNIPYLQVPTYLEFGNNGWGQFDAFYVINPFSSTVLMIDGTFGVIGPSGSSCMFTLSDGVYNESFVLMTSTPNDNVLSDTSTNYSYVVPRALERHFNFYFYNCDVKLDNFTLVLKFSYSLSSITVNMNSQQFDFPISSFFSIYFYNCDMTVETRVCFLKGSSLYMDENSNLILSHRQIDRTYINSLAEHEETIDVAASIFFMDVHVDSYYNNGNDSESMLTTDRHNTNSISSIETYFNAVTPFWKYNVSAYRIAGSLLFEEGNTADIPYSIAGYCDVGSVGTIDTDGKIGTTYNFHTTDSNSYNPFNNLLAELDLNSDREVYFKTYDFDGVNGQFYTESSLSFSADGCDDNMVLQRGRALPLISNGVAYSFSNVYNDEDSELYSINMCGSYNKELDLIDPGDGYFYYYNSNDVDGYDKPYTGTGNTTSSRTSGYYRNREYNHTTRLKQCSYDGNNHYITDSDTSSGTYYYVLFSGCYLPYDTTGNTVNLQRLISKQNSSREDVTLDISVSYSTTYSRWTR